MLIESYASQTKVKVDRKKNRLNNVVVMTTDFNLNHNAKFTNVNQKELIDLGNSTKIYSYLGHAKQGVTSNDRLPYRIGYFENFRIDDSKVVANLILNNSVAKNPFLNNQDFNFKDWIYSLAEDESKEIGLSMVVGMEYNDDDSVSIKELYSVDIVEKPALTLSLFSLKNLNNNMENTILENVHPKLVAAFDAFNELDSNMKSDSPDFISLINNLVNLLNGLLPEPIPEVEVEVEAPVEDVATDAVEAPTVAPTDLEDASQDEATEDATEPTLDDILAMIQSLSDKIDALSNSSFSVDDKATKEPVKKIIFSAPQSDNVKATLSKEQKFEEYCRIKSEEGPKAATQYFNIHLR